MGKGIVAVSLLALLWLATASAAEPPAAKTVDAASYQPKTAHDNTPWRFDMEQNGKRMTADEFDAWMKAKGVRVATGKPTGAASAATTEAVAAD